MNPAIAEILNERENQNQTALALQPDKSDANSFPVDTGGTPTLEPKPIPPETPEQKAERIKNERIAALASYRMERTTHFLWCLMEIERKSTLSVDDFYTGLLALAKNDPMLLAAIQRGETTTGVPDPIPTVKAIEANTTTT